MPLTNTAWGQTVQKWKGTQGSADWYIYNSTLNAETTNFWQTRYDTQKYTDATLYIPNASSTACFMAEARQNIIDLSWLGWSTWILSSTFYVNIDGYDGYFLSWGFDGKSNWTGDDKYVSENKNINIKNDQVKITFGWSGNNYKNKSMTLQVKLPYHLDILNQVTWNNLKTIKFTPAIKDKPYNSPNGAETSTAIDFNSYMKSYFVEEGITFTIENDVNNEFSVAAPTIGANSVFANGTECFNDNNKTIPGTGNNAKANFTVTFKPKTNISGSRLAYLVIKNGNQEIKRIALSADVKDEFYLVMEDVDGTELTELTYNTASFEENLLRYVKPYWYDGSTGLSSPITDLPVDSIWFTEISTDNISCSDDGIFSARKVGIYGVNVTGGYERNNVKYRYTLTIPIVVDRGTLIFDNSAGNNNWFDPHNWAPHNASTSEFEIVPNYVDHNADIQATCTIPSSTYNANCYDLTFSNGGTLTVKPNGKLYVKNKLTSSISELTLENGGSETSTGVVVFNNDSTDASAANATVQLYVPTSTSLGDPTWRYMGIPVDEGVVSGATYVYQWDNSDSHNPNGNGYECWFNVTGNSLDAWSGYSMAKNTKDAGTTENPIPTTVSGQLINTSFVRIPLLINGNLAGQTDYSNAHPDACNNLLTNSFAAPIRINQMSTTDFENAEGTFYFYIDGSHADWANPDHGNIGDFVRNAGPGTFVALPIKSSDAITSSTATIPAGESFFVRAKYTVYIETDEEGGSETIVLPNSITFRYATVKPADSEYSIISPAAPASSASEKPREPEHFNILEIKVAGDSLSDRLFLLENDNCSEKFDNGYDGTKILGIEGTPQLYATTEFGRTAVNVDKTITGQYIGFMAGKHGVHYTISFNTDRLEGYETLYLYDTKENKYVNILKGETYTFTGLRSGEEKRFLIVGKRDAEDEENTITERTGEDKKIDIFGNKALVSGFDGESAEVIISDMAGKIMWTSNTDFGPWFDIPDLPSGVYVMSVDKCQTKFVK